MGLVFLLGGCSLVTRPTPPSAPPSPGGEVAPGWTQEGIASWYGPPFHGRQTASGEIYDMEAPTAAHPSLPFQTVVEVRNLNSGATTTLRINDRGPFVGGRILDVSRRGARELGLLGPGTGPVRITVLEAPAPPSCWEVQVGAFRERQNALTTLAELEARGYRGRVAPVSGGVHRVLAGPWNEYAPAAAFSRQNGGVLAGC